MPAIRRMLAAAGLEGRPTDISASLRELTNRGLLFREGSRYDLHPVVRQHAYARLTDKEGVHSSLRDYFAEIPAPDQHQVRSVEDLAPIIELYHHTVGAGHYDEARHLFYDRLGDPLYFRLGAYNTVIELLRSLFPDGENYPPKLQEQNAQGWTLNELGRSYSRSGQLRRAVPLRERATYIAERLGSSKRNIAACLSDLAGDQYSLGELEAAERNLRRCIQVSRETGRGREEEFQEAIRHQELGLLLAYKGASAESTQESETALDRFRKQSHAQGEGQIWAYSSIRALLMGLSDAALEAARQAHQLAVARVNERDIIQAE